MSAPLCNWLAQALVIDGFTHPEVCSMASLGTQGMYKANIRRDMHVKFPVSPHIPKPVLARVPVKHVKTKVINFTAVPILMVNQVFDFLYLFHRDRFMEFVAGLQEFWTQVRPDDPKLIDHPMTMREAWRNKAVPLLLHGDGVRFSMKGNVLLCIEWAFLLAKGWSLDTIFLIASFPKICRVSALLDGVGQGTWDILWSYIVLGFQSLFLGIHPSLDPDGNSWPVGSQQAHLAGRKIAGGFYFGVLWLMPMDLDFACNELGVRHFNSNEPCLHGRCNRSTLNFRNVLPDAPWRATKRQPGLQNHVRVSPHLVWSIPGVTRFMYPGDLMHTGCSGVVINLHGSAFLELTEPTGPFRGTRARNTEKLWALISQKYDDHHIQHDRMQHLEPKMFCKNDWSVLSGINASSARVLVPVMLDVLRDLNDGSDCAAQRIEAL
jgi:hypothetical protein